jgi:hypothetical protein
MHTHQEIKQVTQARLVTHRLAYSSLESLMAPCLGWSHRYISQRPKGKDLTRKFRSQEFEDAANDVFPTSCHTSFTSSLVTAFDKFLDVRKRAVLKNRIGDEEIRRELSRSKSLLVTDWSASLFDAVMTPETDGFIDKEGMPPWDTWICLIEAADSHGIACLLSWVPSWLAENMDSAIRVDAASSLSWIVVSEEGNLQLNGWGQAWQ